MTGKEFKEYHEYVDEVRKSIEIFESNEDLMEFVSHLSVVKEKIKSYDVMMRYLEGTPARDTSISLMLHFSGVLPDHFGVGEMPDFELDSSSPFREVAMITEYRPGYLGIDNKRKLRTLPEGCQMVWHHADGDDPNVMQAGIERFTDARYKNGLFRYQAVDLISAHCHSWTFGEFTLSKNDIVLLMDKGKHFQESCNAYFEFQKIINQILRNPLVVAETINFIEDDNCVDLFSDKPNYDPTW